jgi:hypothetical protein
MPNKTSLNKIKKEHVLLFFPLNWIREKIEPWIPAKIKQSVTAIIDDFAKWLSSILSTKINNPLLSNQNDKEFILVNNKARETINPESSSLFYWIWDNMREGIFYISQNSFALFVLIAATQIPIVNATGELTPTPIPTPTFPALPTLPESTMAPSTTNPWDADLVKGIVSGGVSGLIGVTFFCFKVYAEHKTRKRLDHIPEGESMTERMASHRSTLVLPLARIIFDSIKLTNYVGSISDETMTDYLSSIEVLIFALLDHGMLTNFETLPGAEQSMVLQQIAREAKSILISRARASSATRCNFFPPQITPIDIEKHAEEIAQRVQSTQSGIIPPLPIIEVENLEPEAPLLR